MNSKTVWVLRQVLRRIWVRVVAFALLALAMTGAARLIGPAIPSEWQTKIGADSVDQVLGILASSMLAVTTFSLSIAVSAFTAAASNATPRATLLLQEDRTTQNVLATFLGAFLFSLVGVVALNAGLYDNNGRLVLFAGTVLVVAGVVAALLRWITHLMSFGRVEDILERVERAARGALQRRVAEPYLGGRARHAPPPQGATAVRAASIGYVQHIDMEALEQCARTASAHFWLAVLPGSFVHPARELLWASSDGALDDAALERIRGAFVCESVRNFEQDPRFGVIALAEIASRALSPAVNDPGTAIDILGRLVRALALWREPVDAAPRHEHLHVPPLRAAELLEDAFQPIARDGAGMIEVQIRLHKALAALTGIAPEVFGASAARMSAEALERARSVLTLPADIQRLEALSRELTTAAPPEQRPAGL